MDFYPQIWYCTMEVSYSNIGNTLRTRVLTSIQLYRKWWHWLPSKLETRPKWIQCGLCRRSSSLGLLAVVYQSRQWHVISIWTGLCCSRKFPQQWVSSKYSGYRLQIYRGCLASIWFRQQSWKCWKYCGWNSLHYCPCSRKRNHFPWRWWTENCSFLMG